MRKKPGSIRRVAPDPQRARRLACKATSRCCQRSGAAGAPWEVGSRQQRQRFGGLAGAGNPGRVVDVQANPVLVRLLKKQLGSGVLETLRRRCPCALPGVPHGHLAHFPASVSRLCWRVEADRLFVCAPAPALQFGSTGYPDEQLGAASRASTVDSDWYRAVSTFRCARVDLLGVRAGCCSLPTHGRCRSVKDSKDPGRRET